MRRKLRDLQRSGWIIKHDNGNLIASTKAAQDLAPATEATPRYLATVAPPATQP